MACLRKPSLRRWKQILLNSRVLGVRNIVTCIAAVLIILAPIRASVDRACSSGDFQLVATPEKAGFSKAEEVVFRLTATNRTQPDVWIVPHLFPFDYSVERFSRGGWKEMGGMVPAARSRRNMPLGPRDQSEYRVLKSAETYSASFVVAPELLGKAKSGQFQIRVRVYFKEMSDQNLRNLGCAMFTELVPFSVK